MEYRDDSDEKLNLSDEEIAFIKIYKGNNKEENIKRIYGNNANTFLLSPLLSYENMNKFLNFLNEPSDDLLHSIDFSGVSEMIDMAVNLINASVKYSAIYGPIKKVLYRAENIKNLPGYQSGELTSIKSTTEKSRVSTGIFGYEGAENIAYKVYGYCPYIFVENVNEDGEFSNEAEYLFPPYVKCSIKDEKTISREGETFHKVIEIADDFSFEEVDDMMVSDEQLSSYIEKFQRLAGFDKNTGKVSEETKMLAKVINCNLRNYARNKYTRGKLDYDFERKFDTSITYDVLTGNDTFMNVHLAWDEKYRGFEDALIQYYQEPNRNWADDNTIHVYTLSYMIDKGFIDMSLLEELYGNNNCKSLDTFFLDKNYKMSDEDYSKFLNAFNIMAGYGEHGKDELFEVKNKMSNSTIDMLYDNKNYGNASK